MGLSCKFPLNQSIDINIGDIFSLIPDVPWHRPGGLFSEELKIVPLTSAQQAPWQAASSMEKRLILLQNTGKYHREVFFASIS